MPIFKSRPAPPPPPQVPKTPARPTGPRFGDTPPSTVLPVTGPSIFGGGGRNPTPAPTMSGFGNLSAGEGRSMANRNPAPTGRFPTTKMKKGGKVSSASKRADGIAVKGKTKGKIV